MGSAQVIVSSADNPGSMIWQIGPIHLVDNAFIVECSRIEGMKGTFSLSILLRQHLLKRHLKVLLIHIISPTIF
jgi:hypothetical protein